jgi:hypothetical protein
VSFVGVEIGNRRLAWGRDERRMRMRGISSMTRMTLVADKSKSSLRALKKKTTKKYKKNKVER